MNKELEALNKIAGITNYDGGKNLKALGNSHKKEFNLIETALKRNIELEEENKILRIIRDNFDLWIEPNYRATLQFQQNSSLTQSDYEKLIEYFGEPRDE